MQDETALSAWAETKPRVWHLDADGLNLAAADLQSDDARALMAKRGQVEWRSDQIKGLWLRAYRSGAWAWLLRYFAEGRAWTMTIGEAQDAEGNRIMAPDDAHAKARDVLADVRLYERGKIPAHPAKALKAARAEARGAHAEARAAATVAELCDQFLEHRHTKSLKPNTLRGYHWAINGRIRPAWAKRKAADIQSADVAKLIGTMGSVTSNRVRGVVSILWAFGIEQGIVKHNPAEHIRPTREQPRDRWLNERELRAVFEQCDALPFTPAAGNIIRLAILTGQRQAEIGQVRNRELDLENAVWTLPAERAKNHREHLIPLTGWALSILKASAGTDPSALVFAEGGSTPTINRAMVRIRAALQFEKSFCFHDFRRTAATHWGRIKIEPHVISALLNHSPRGVTGRHYNQFDYFDAKREALEAWDRELARIIEGKPAKVIPFPVAAA